LFLLTGETLNVTPERSSGTKLLHSTAGEHMTRKFREGAHPLKVISIGG